MKKRLVYPFIVIEKRDETEIIYKHTFRKFKSLVAYASFIAPLLLYSAYSLINYYFTGAKNTKDYAFAIIFSWAALILGIIILYSSIKHIVVLINWRLKIKNNRLYFRNKDRLWESVFGYDTVLLQGKLRSHQYGKDYNLEVVLSLKEKKKKLLLSSPAMDAKNIGKIADGYIEICQLLANKLNVKYIEKGGFEEISKTNTITETVY